jgi:hypothetical protein
MVFCFPPNIMNYSLVPTILPNIKIIDLFTCKYYCSSIKMGFYHRWPRFLTQQTSITFYRLPTKGKQTFVWRKQTEDCRVHFPYMYWNGSIYIYILPFKTETEAQAIILIRLPFIVQTEVCRLSVCLWRNKGIFVCKRTKRTCSSMVSTVQYSTYVHYSQDDSITNPE